MHHLLKVLKAAGDDSRLRALNILRLRSLCVCEIADVLGLAQSTVSRHLKVLEDAGLLERSKEGLWVEYRLTSAPEDSTEHRLISLVDQEFSASDAARADEARARSADRRKICART
ncbi:MAG: metalloregulator ArsR/SmtB family transcription factor [Candidatus Latescibacteria bacterium]|jgi:ArsR family transcriptional regulator|nr:metalloregulator ArsR/SmtB family transcription factor [Candidatus Latescibacterota bacterium]